MASVKSLRKARIRVRELRDTFEGHDASRCIQDVFKMYQDVRMCRIYRIYAGFALKSYEVMMSRNKEKESETGLYR